ncbi:MAG: short-chain dehydrogenase [Pseudonocardiales bacterium]|nr:MAG: short-chain dehydrogenase [Pseudonocardiales bacterium]
MVDDAELRGRVALVAGATRGAGRGIAVELARAGAVVYATGRSSVDAGRSEIGRPETIDETGELIRAAGGTGHALRVDHLQPDDVGRLIERIDAEHGRLDILVNDIFGGDRYAQWDKTLWEHDLDGGLRLLRMGIDTHLITSAKALPLILRHDGGVLIEMTDGTTEFNRAFRRGVGLYYDLVKAAVGRIVVGLTAELEDATCTPLAVTPGWLRSEQMLENFRVTETTWRDALEKTPHFCCSESPTYVGRGIAALAADPGVDRYAGRTVSSAELARTYGITDVDGTQPDCWRYVAEIQSAKRPASERGYR